MATKEITVYQARKRLKATNLDIILIYMIASGFYLLSQGEVILTAFVFYLTLFVGLYTHVVAKSQLLGLRSYLYEFIDYDFDDVWSPLIIWGLMVFLILGFFYKVTGASVSFASLDVAFFQLILVVPSETLIFIVMLPKALEAGYGKFPLTNTKVPGWFWAQVLFAVFHFWAYGHVISVAVAWKMGIAFMMGCIFYLLYAYGKENKKVGGIMGCMGLHFVLNYWALSTSSIYLFVL